MSKELLKKYLESRKKHFIGPQTPEEWKKWEEEWKKKWKEERKTSDRKKAEELRKKILKKPISELNRELNYFKQSLVDANTSAAQHLKKAHGGIPHLTCHTCGIKKTIRKNYQYLIINQEKIIAEKLQN